MLVFKLLSLGTKAGNLELEEIYVLLSPIYQITSNLADFEWAQSKKDLCSKSVHLQYELLCLLNFRRKD